MGVDKATFIKAETIESGHVKLSIFIEYFKKMGFFLTGCVIFGQVVSAGISIGSSVWLSTWSQANDDLKQTTNDTALPVSETLFYFEIYGLIGHAEIMAVLIRGLILSWGCVNAAKILHQNLLDSISRAPMSFFDTTPLGRIVNRFSKDVNVVDDVIEMSVGMWLVCFLQVISTIAVVTWATPPFIAVVLPLMCGFRENWCSTIYERKPFSTEHGQRRI